MIEIENNLENTLISNNEINSVLYNKSFSFKKTLKKTSVIRSRKVKKVFNSLKLLIPEEINFKIFKWNMKKFKNNSKLAWILFILLTTSVLTNKVPDDEGNFKLILEGIYSVFKDIKKNLLEFQNSKITTEITLILLNKELRPFLGKWHSKNINEDFIILNEDFKQDLIKLQNTIRTQYLEKFSDLSSLFHSSSKIKNYVNY